MKTCDISEYLVPGKRVHLIGIGGVSMRPLGLVLKGMGLEVSGSDMSASLSTDELIEKASMWTLVTGQKISGALTVSSALLQLITTTLRLPLPAAPVFRYSSGHRPGARL